MNDKPVAMLVTFVIVLPLYAMCCLGPAVAIGMIGSLLGWLTGWMGPVPSGLAVLALLLAAWWINRRTLPDHATPADASRGRADLACCSTGTRPARFPDQVVVQVGSRGHDADAIFPLTDMTPVGAEQGNRRP